MSNNPMSIIFYAGHTVIHFMANLIQTLLYEYFPDYESTITFVNCKQLGFQVILTMTHKSTNEQFRYEFVRGFFMDKKPNTGIIDFTIFIQRLVDPGIREELDIMNESSSQINFDKKIELNFYNSPKYISEVDELFSKN